MSLSPVLRLAHRLHEATSLSEAMEFVVDSVSEATRYRRAYLLLPIEGGIGLDLVGYAVADRTMVTQRMSEHDWRRDRFLSQLLSTTRPLVIPDLREHPDADQRQVEHFGNRTAVVVPMLRLGQRLGAFVIATYAAEGVIVPSAEELAYAQEVGALITVVAGRLAAEEKHRALEATVVREQRLEALGRMAGEVAHDLNNMLVPILGNAELAARLVEDGSMTKELLEEVLSAGRRAAELTRRLLAFSRSQPVERCASDTDLVITKLEPMLRAMLPANITLLVSHRTGLGCVLINPGQLEQIVMNLVLNARDAITGIGTITLTIDSIMRGDRIWTTIAVEDTGVGMPPEVACRIFEPFYTTKPSGRGTGLGLAVVDGVVRTHGGMVEVASRPGEGSRFTVLLPQTDLPPVIAPVPAPGPIRQSGSEHILVADDDAAVRVLIERLLTGAGYRVTLACNGDEALARIAEHSDIALLLTDIVMPGRTGDELERELATRLPVLLMSGYAPEQTRVPVGTRVLAKPFTTAELLSLVRITLDGFSGVGGGLMSDA